MVRAEQTDGRQPMTWSSVDWTATEAVVGRIQDRIFRAAKIKRPRLEPDDEQSSCPVLRGLGSGNGARLPDGVVEAVGEGVTRFRPGDRVVGVFFQGWLEGEPSAEKLATGLGDDLDGVLCESRVFDEAGLLP